MPRNYAQRIFRRRRDDSTALSRRALIAAPIGNTGAVSASVAATRASRRASNPLPYTYLYETHELAQLAWPLYHASRAPPRCSPYLSASLTFTQAVRYTKCHVTRGNYAEALAFMASDKWFGTIVGPTACGKTTFALLEILNLGVSMLLVQPAGSNVASVMVEFKFRIPMLVEQLSLDYRLPTVAHNAFNGAIDSPAQLNVCTSTDLLRFVIANGCYPPVDVIVLDEFHLPREDHVICRQLLQHLRNNPNPQKLIFVSATPPDEPPPPVRTAGLTINELKMPDPLSEPLPPIYLRRTLGKYGNDVYLIIADSCVTSHKLVARLHEAGENACSICPCVSPERTERYFKAFTEDFTFVATPDTEAGLTVDCSYMANPGTVLKTHFRSGVLYSAVFRLGPRQTVQRLGRAGRLRHTIVFTDPGTGDGGLDAPSPVSAGAGYLHTLAYSGQHPTTTDSALAVREFPRLSHMTPLGAFTALKTPTPVLSIYRTDRNGNTFVEFGGKALGFVEQCGPLMKLFTWPGGRAFSPFLDLTTYHDPTAGQTIESLRSLSEAAFSSKPALAASLDIDRALGYAEREPGAFATAIWLALKETRGEPNLTGHDLHSERTTPSYMFGRLGFRAWCVLAGLGAYVDVVRHNFAKNGIDRRPTFRGESFSYCSYDVLGADGKVSDAKVTALLLPHLKPVSITFLLQDDPDLSTNLCHFRFARGRSSNGWFNALKL